MVGLLKRDRNRSGGLAHFIERFESMNRMVNDLFFLSKADTSQAELRMAHLRLDYIIEDLYNEDLYNEDLYNEDLYNLFKPLAEEKKIDLNLDETKEVILIGDKVRLQQLFTNLIDNAIKYTQKGSIQISLEKNKEVAIVRIRDTGIGISREEQENIFKRFYRVDKSGSRETGGVGLGLSIAQWIAQAHHGRIDMESIPNQGSTFTVYLPI